MSDKVDFLHADKHKSLLQIDVEILMGKAKHFQSSQNSNFAMCLQYLKKEVRDEVDFLIADKYSKFAISLKYLKKYVRNGVHFSHADKYQNFYKLALSFLVEVARHVQSTQNRNLLMLLQHI